MEKNLDLENGFEGNEKLILKSLISWLHDGSHSIHDDLLITRGGDSIGIYMKVFKDIFYKTGHGNHYEMMMR